MAKSNSSTNSVDKDDDKFFKSLIKATDNPFAEIAEQGGANITGYIDTGSAALNALISGSIRGGYPKNKITGLAGDPSTGKTFFMLSAVKSFLEDNPRGRAFLFDSEFNLSKDLLSARGIDCARTVIVPVETIEQFRTQAINILDKYLEVPKEKRWPMFMALDSLGMLSTSKEMDDMISGKEAVDMTKARLVKGAFRALTLKLGKADVPMIVTNHTYMTIGMFASKKMGGGTGLEYAASTIIFLSKKKDKDSSGRVNGVEITALLKKSRQTHENQEVTTYLSYANGLDPYYGLLEVGVNCGVLKALPRKEYQFPDGEVLSESEIAKDPSQYFTDELLDLIDMKCQKVYAYSSEDMEVDNLLTEPATDLAENSEES